MLCMYSLFEFPLSIDFQISFRTEAKTTNFPLGCGQIETAEMLQLHVSLRPSSVPLSSPSSSTNASPLQNSALSLLICFCNDDCIIESETSVDLVCASSIASACQTNSEMSSSWNLVSSRSLDTIFDGKPVMNWYRNVCWVAGMFSRTHRSYSVLNSIVYSRTFWPEFFCTAQTLFVQVRLHFEDSIRPARMLLCLTAEISDPHQVSVAAWCAKLIAVWCTPRDMY